MFEETYKIIKLINFKSPELIKLFFLPNISAESRLVFQKQPWMQIAGQKLRQLEINSEAGFAYIKQGKV